MTYAATLSEHLLSTLPIASIGHFTFPARATSEHRNNAWKTFIKHVERVHGGAVGWIRADETDEKGNRHVHAAFASYRPVSNHLLEDVWAYVNGVPRTPTTDVARCLTYDPAYRTIGMEYIIKDDDLHFSDNLALFSSMTDPKRLKAPERRQYLRIRAA